MDRRRQRPSQGAQPPGKSGAPLPGPNATRTGGSTQRLGIVPTGCYSTPVPIIDDVRASAAKQVLFLPHAIRQMTRTDRMISTSRVIGTVSGGELIEDYPDDSRGHSCLILGTGSGRPVHVVCSPKADYLAIITAYEPNPTLWSADFRTRKPK